MKNKRKKLTREERAKKAARNARRNRSEKGLDKRAEQSGLVIARSDEAIREAKRAANASADADAIKEGRA